MNEEKEIIHKGEIISDKCLSKYIWQGKFFLFFKK